jgi:hypothetical protein
MIKAMGSGVKMKFGGERRRFILSQPARRPCFFQGGWRAIPGSAVADFGRKSRIAQDHGKA